MSYDHKQIEKFWIEKWDIVKLYKTKEDNNYQKEKRFYCLDMFPYPSGSGLHVGHPEGYTASDIISRYKRMNDFNVLHPMGWDAFGLPAENYAIKTKTHPKFATKKNIARFKEQIKSFGFSYDWDREVDTTDPNYYKWTQWIFLKLYEKGLAYQAEVPINWCQSCKTGLANEEVKDGKCDRCNSLVSKKNLKQWLLKITDYADRLLADLDKLNWSNAIKTMQKNWIGKSIGAEVDFNIKDLQEKITVFTTRPDTLFGATYLVLAPEHPLAQKICTDQNIAKVKDYIMQSQKKSDLERLHLEKEKTGVFTGTYAINPVNQVEIPIWIADYVLMSYGTGAIMAVPAHDQRDFEFAKKFALPIKKVVDSKNKKLPDDLETAFEEEGYAVNSCQFDGLATNEFKEKIIDFLVAQKTGKKAIKYKLRDWVFSRQRYWGEPIPIIHCENCGIVPLTESDLPLLLPEVDNYEPSDDGQSPLAKITDWVNTTCPKCLGNATRETNTMPQWAGSCWYFIRYLDPKNDKALASQDIIDYWLPVDLYIGGAEHAVLHLLYSRFWYKFFYDIGIVKNDEPFIKLVNQGLILAEDGQKMSKSLGNVVNPDDLIAEYGADVVRLYEMFLGPLEMVKPWSSKGIIGMRRFLEKVFRIFAEDNYGKLDKDIENINILKHQTIYKVTKDIENLSFNTAISALMIFTNEITSLKQSYSKKLIIEIAEILLILLAPFAPFLTEEIWCKYLGNKDSIHKQAWPTYNQAMLKQNDVTYAIQINGKLKETLSCEMDASQDIVKKKAFENDKIKKAVLDKEIVKLIFVPNKILNIVIK